MHGRGWVHSAGRGCAPGGAASGMPGGGGGGGGGMLGASAGRCGAGWKDRTEASSGTSARSTAGRALRMSLSGGTAFRADGAMTCGAAPSRAGGGGVGDRSPLIQIHKKKNKLIS